MLFKVGKTLLFIPFKACHLVCVHNMYPFVKRRFMPQALAHPSFIAFTPIILYILPATEEWGLGLISTFVIPDKAGAPERDGRRSGIPFGFFLLYKTKRNGIPDSTFFRLAKAIRRESFSGMTEKM